MQVAISRSMLLLLSVLCLFASCSLEKQIQGAEKRLAQQDYPKSLKKLQRILKKHPDNISARLGIANCYFLMEDYDQSARYYRGVLDQDRVTPTLCAYEQEVYRWAESEFIKARYEEALQQYRRLMQHCGRAVTRPKFFLNAGISAFRQGQKAIQKGSNADLDRASKLLSEADGYLQKSRDRFNKHDEVVFRRAEVAFQRQQYPGAIQVFSDLIHRFRKSSYLPRAKELAATSHLILAEQAYQAKDYPNVLLQLDFITRFQVSLTKSYQAQCLQGLSLYHLQRYQEAVIVLEQLSRGSGDRREEVQQALGETYFQLALSSFEEKHYGQVLRQLRLAEQYRMDLVETEKGIYARSESQYQLKRYQQALVGFQQLGRHKRTDHFTILHKIGNCQYYLGDYKMALSTFQELVKQEVIYPKDLVAKMGKCQFEIGLTYFEAAEYELAKSFFDQARLAWQAQGEEFWLELVQLAFYQAQILQQEGQLEPALDKFIQVCQTHEALDYRQKRKVAAIYRKAVAHVAQLALRLERFGQAIPYLEHQLEGSGSADQAALQYRLALCHAQVSSKGESLNRLFALYDSEDYHAYRDTLGSAINYFKSLAGIPGFDRWRRGIRRLKLTVHSAYSNESDMGWTENDMTVIVTQNNRVLLSTEQINDDNYPQFSWNQLVLDYRIGDDLTFMLMESDYGWGENDCFLYQSSTLHPGNGLRLVSSQGRVNYSLTDTNEQPYSMNQRIPPELRSSNNAVVCFGSCYLQGSVNEIVWQIIQKIFIGVPLDWNKMKRETLLDIINYSLKETNNEGLANGLQIYRFVDCYRACMQQ